MAEYSRGSFAGRFRQWRGQRAQARAAARWPAAPESAPGPGHDPEPAVDPLTTRWLPEPEPSGDDAPAAAADPSAPSRWLTSETNAPAVATKAAPAVATEALPEASTAATTALAAPALDWLPRDLEQDGDVPAKVGDSSRWVPEPDAGAAAGQPDEAGEPEEDEVTRMRRAAAEAYCSVLCPPAAVTAAVAEALDMAGESDRDLLRATRSAAAARAVPTAPAKTWRQRLAAEHEEPCAVTPRRLAERANGTLISGEQRELERHLATCADCQAAEERERQATDAFAGVLPAPVEYERLDPKVARWAPTAGATTAAAGATAATAPGAADRWTPVGAAASWAAEQPIAAPAPTGPDATPEPQRRRRRRGLFPLLAASAVLAALAIAAVVILTRPSGTGQTLKVHTQATGPAPKATIAHSTSAAKGHSRASRHRQAHHRAVHHPAHKATHTKAATVGVHSTPASEPVTHIPVVTPHPVAPSVHTSTPATSVSTVSQSSLPPESAPQQGVGKPPSGR